MKKIIIILLLTISINSFADSSIEFKQVIGFVNQFNNQNYVSTGLNIQTGVQFKFDVFCIGLFGEICLTTGYPYGFEYHVGNYFEIGINNIYLGVGYFLFGNVFPMIKGIGYGSDFYNLHCLRLHSAIINNYNFKLMPYINMYFDINEKHTNNLIKIDEHKFGYGIILNLIIPDKRKVNNNLINQNKQQEIKIIEIEIPVEKIVEIQFPIETIIEKEIPVEKIVEKEIESVHTVELIVEKPVFIEVEKEIFIEIKPPQLYDKNGWFLHYDTNTGIARWIHNPDLSLVGERPLYDGFIERRN